MFIIANNPKSRLLLKSCYVQVYHMAESICQQTTTHKRLITRKQVLLTTLWEAIPPEVLLRACDCQCVGIYVFMVTSWSEGYQRREPIHWGPSDKLPSPASSGHVCSLGIFKEISGWIGHYEKIVIWSLHGHFMLFIILFISYYLHIKPGAR